MRWEFPVGGARAEAARVAQKLRRRSRFYVFLFEVREELFDDDFQEELMRAYEPRGQRPCPPALMAMAMLLQRYTGASDADAVEEASTSRRWQLVLGNLGAEDAPFGQGSLVRFRERMIEHDLDKKLLDRTVELAKRTKKFGWKKLKVMFDSSPLEGAGRVEDTWNLIGRAMGKVVDAVAEALGVERDQVIEAAGLTIFDAPSVKAALDIDWSDEDERHDALQRLLSEADVLAAWVREEVSGAAQPPVSTALKLLDSVIEQDIEPDPDGGGHRIRDGVAQDRVISVGDPEMRHGRKSRSKTIRGFKRHAIIANRIFLGTAVEPANRREHVPTGRLLDDARRHGVIKDAYFDRGYLPAPEVAALLTEGAQIHSRSWHSSNRGYFVKEDFHIDLDAGSVVCPAGATAPITPSGAAYFTTKDCARCRMKRSCTPAARRSVRIHPQEEMLIGLRESLSTRTGRENYRSRVEVEHRLARVEAIQGPKARYKGARKNEMDLNRTAAVANLQEVDRLRRAA